MKSIAKRIAIILVVGFGLAAQAQADNLTVSLSDGTTTLTCADGAACDGSSIAGVVVFSTDFGTVSVTGAGTGAPQSAALDLDLGYVVSSPNPAGTFTISVSENNLSGSDVTWGGTIGGTNSGTSTSWAAFADADNALFGTATGLCSGGPSSANPLAGTCISVVPFGDPSFSLTEVVTVTTTGGRSIASGNFSLSTVPEPATLLLLGSALAGIGVLRRRLGWTA